jgi:hypothetical protein
MEGKYILKILLTGGGPAKLLKKDASDNLLLSLMGDKTVYGLSNSFDCDNVQPVMRSIMFYKMLLMKQPLNFKRTVMQILLWELLIGITDTNNENTDNEQEFASQQ